nr:ribonuclease E/G [Cellulomonas sp. C5510]
MTLDNTSDTTPAAAPGGEQAEATTRPRRTPRKRVTKAAGSPGAPEPAADAPAAVVPAGPADPGPAPAADDAPATPVRRRTPRRTKAQLAAEAAAHADEAGAPEVPAEATAPEPEEAPTPRRRRSTRRAAAPAADAPAAAEAPQAPVADAQGAPAAEQPAPAAAEQPVAEQAPAEQPVAEQPVAEQAPAEQPAAEQPVSRARRSRRATRPTAAPVEPGSAAPVGTAAAQPEPAAPVDEPLIDEPEDEQIAETVEQAEQTSAAAPESRLDVLAELGRTTPAGPAASPAAPGGDQDRSAARLATTALLFQAPEAPRRRRRAQAPSGSPETISAAAQAEDARTADAGPAPAAPADEQPAPSRRRGRRGRTRPEEAPEAAEAPEVDGTEVPLPQDEAAVDADEQPAGAAEDGDTEQDGDEGAPRRRRRRGGRGRRSRGTSDGDAESADAPEDGDDDQADGGQDADGTDGGDDADDQSEGDEQGGGSRRRRRRRRSGRGGEQGESEPRRTGGRSDEVTALRGSTRLEAKRQRRREGRDAGRRRQIITEAEFLARRESVERSMIVREAHGKTQIAVLEDGVLVEHYVSRQAQVSMAGNVYLGRVQNVLPSMEAAFVDVGKGRNAVLYAGEVNWDAAGLEGGQPRRIEQALKSGDSVLVQVTKDPIGHKGARLTSQVTLAGRYLVYVPGGGMTGISRKLPEPERARLKKILREVVPDSAGVIVRTAAEGASEEELRADIARLQSQWEAIEKKAKTASAPALLQGEPDLAIRVVRDIFNDDFSSLVVQGDGAWSTISSYIGELAPDLAQKVSKYTGTGDVFHDHRVDEQLAKGMDRKVWLPSGGSLVIDRTEAMTVVDVNTGKFTGAGGTLEETVTRNNLEAAEEIVRQLRLRDIGGIIVIDFIDMVLESNRDLVLRRLVECLGRDRTKHQVAEVTSLGLVQMTRKRVGQGLVEAFSETCEHCNGRGFIVHAEPVERGNGRPDAGAPQQAPEGGEAKKSRRKRGGAKEQPAASAPTAAVPVLPEAREAVKATLATIAAAAAHAHAHDDEPQHDHDAEADGTTVARTVVAERVEQVVGDGGAAQDPAADRAPEPDPHPVVLDVFAALGDLAHRSGTADEPGTTGRAASAADEGGGRLELTPVDPGLFELPAPEETDEPDEA